MKGSRFISLMLAGLLGITSISFPTEVLGREQDVEVVEVFDEDDKALAAESEDTVEVVSEETANDKDGAEDWLEVELTESGWACPYVDETKVPEDVKSAAFYYQLCVEKEDGTEEKLSYFRRDGINNLEPMRFHQKYFNTSGRLFCYIRWGEGENKHRVLSNYIDYEVPSQKLSSPENVQIINIAGKKYLRWDEVDDCDGYFVDIFREEYGRDKDIAKEIDENSFNLSDVLDQYDKSWKYDIEITANSGDITETRCSEPATISYSPIYITLDQEEISLATGNKGTIKAEFSEEPADKTLIWKTSDPTVASVDQSGIVTAVGPGEADIWVEALNGTRSENSCRVTVYDQIKSIKLDPSSKTMNTGDEFVLRADVGAYTVTDSTIITTTGSTVVTGPALSFVIEDDNLSITPYGAGKVLVKAASSIGDKTSVKSKVIVKATDGSNKKAECSVTINAPKVEKIALKKLGLNETSVTLKENTNFKLKPQYTPENATATAKFEFADEKSKDYITIDEEGLITTKELPSGISEAVAKVKVTATDYKGTKKEAYCTVTVINSEVKVNKITLPQSKISMGSNASLLLTATVAPSWADNKDVTWSLSKEGIVECKEFTYYKNKVTIIAKNPGTVDVTATASDGSGQSATCTITVGNPVESVTIKNKAKLDGSMLTVGKTIKLKADVTAASGKPANPQVTWKSDDKSVATVDSTGKVTAKSSGTVTITAKAEEVAEGEQKTDSVTLIIYIPVKKMAANGKTSIIAYEGSRGQIPAPIITPANATYQAVSWTSSDNDTLTLESDVTEGKNLTFVANKPGKVKVTGVTREKKKLTFTVTIRGRMHKEDVKLNIKSVPKGLVVIENNSKNVTVEALNAAKKQSIKLTPVLSPKAYNKKVTFTSSNPNAVKVDKNGKITAVGEGSSRITMTTEDGNFTAVCMVTTINKK